MGLRRGHAVTDLAPGRGRCARRIVLGCALAALLAGCTPLIHQQGHISDAEALNEIEPGVQTREDVARLLGTPSAVGTFDEKRWYYMSRRTETTAFYAPELVDQSVTVIAFNEGGVVAEVATLSIADALAIEPVAEESPTRGREPGLLEQLLGNIGRPIPTTQ